MALLDKCQTQATKSSEQDFFPASAGLEPAMDQKQGSILYRISHTVGQGASGLKTVHMSIFFVIVLPEFL